MQHSQLEQWSRRSSLLHTLDARAKLIALLVFLIAVATTRNNSGKALAGYALLVACALSVSGLPWGSVVLRALSVLPFSLSIAVAAWWGGGSYETIAGMIAKNTLSVAATIIMMGTTPWTRLMRAFERFRLPRDLVLSIEFLYRYLHVIAGEVGQMRLAAMSRGGTNSVRNARAASGMIGILFARSWERAEGVHRAMLARGFSGTFPLLHPSTFALRDAGFVTLVTLAAVAIRVTS